MLCDFAGGVAALFNKPSPQAGDPSQPLHEYIGVPKGLMWSRIRESGPKLWENLEPMPWANDLVALARSAGEVMIATSPSLQAASLSGKLSWLQRRFGVKFRDFVISPHKYLLARPQHILVDDTLKHVESFRKLVTGGPFPSVENGMLTTGQDPYRVLKTSLQPEWTSGSRVVLMADSYRT